MSTRPFVRVTAGNTDGNRTNNQQQYFSNIGGFITTIGAGHNASSITISENDGCQSITICGNPGNQSFTVEESSNGQGISMCANCPSVNIGMNSVIFSSEDNSEEYSVDEDSESSMSPHQAEAVDNNRKNGPSKGAPQAVIDSLPTYWQDSAITKGKDHEQCMICLDVFQDGSELCLLPCMHRYHAPCIHKWLTRNSTCPLCGNNILES